MAKNKICPNCSKKFRKRKVIYCCADCYREDYDKKREKVVLSGKASHRVAKHYLVKTYGLYCWICDIKEWKGKPLPFILDHKNGNYKDNRVENLRLVCSNCDSQLSTYKSKNKGNGRPTVKKRKRSVF